ncbi:hypothetical protein THTE_0440 [Thermogutta terrifontis]|uniref:Uncharacterized protein n=1 Tax=Thermogutta terrifontis TaxID=1331910 RepID=A0A286RAQ6_9BACT|nr:hypothetical protein [Thermogutta terrifontis]ASV73042.1 hypothetical protein THTE_0440 [Thermogutta terrifontis]
MTRFVTLSAVCVCVFGMVAGKAFGQAAVPQAWQNETYVYAASQMELSKGQAALIQAYATLLQAQAAMVKAQADAQVSLAQARKVHLEGNAVQIDNSLKYAKAYWDRKQARDTYLALQNKPTPSPGESKHPAQQTAAVQVKPQRLTAAELDPVTHTIHWPAVLQGERYAQYRAAIEELFAARQPSDHGAASPFYSQVRKNVEILSSMLREEITRVSPAEYLAGKKFLDGLRNEALYPPQMNNVAMNN